MKKIKGIFFKKIIFIVISLIVVFSSIVGVISLITKDNKKYEIQDLSDGWNVLQNRSKMNNIDILEHNFYGLKKGQTIVATKVLSAENYNIVYPILDISTRKCLVDVYINNKKIGGNISANKKDKAKNNLTVTLPYNYEKMILKIEFEIQEDDIDKVLESISIISENDYVNYKIRDNILSYLIGAIILILGLILVISVICIPNKDNKTRRLLWIGGTFLFAGLAMYARYNILDLYINNSSVSEFIEIMGVFLLIPCIMMLGYEILVIKKHKKYLISYNIFIIMVFIASVVLKETGIIRYDDIVNTYILAIYVSALIMFVFGLTNYKLVDSIDRIALVGLMIGFVQGMITILINKILPSNIWEEQGEIYIIAIIFEFFIAMIIYYAYVVKQYMNNITEQRILSALAYTDPLTGIMNRTKYEEVIADIKNRLIENIVIVSFDLNNLKKINDNKGHEAGDTYIKEFSHAMKKTFEEHGIICRIGGDEFVAIIENRIVDVYKQIEKMQKVFLEGMKDKKCEFEASFAYGVSDSSKDNSKDIDKLINMADERMYECKKEQKMGRD